SGIKCKRVIIVRSPSVCGYFIHVSSSTTSDKWLYSTTRNHTVCLILTLEKQTNIESFIFTGNAKTISQCRHITLSDLFGIIRINFAVSIKVFVLNVSRHNLSKLGRKITIIMGDKSIAIRIVLQGV